MPNVQPNMPGLADLARLVRQTSFAQAAPLAQMVKSGGFSTEIAFVGSSERLPGDAETALSAIADRMKANAGLQARLRGGASTGASTGDDAKARQIALARALSVQRYLVSKGVLSDSIKVEAVSSDNDRDGVFVTLIAPA